MPRLPIYEQQLLPRGDLGDLRGYGGSATGEALQGLGRTLSGVGEQLHDFQVQDERIEVQRDMSRVQMEWMRRFDEASKAAPLGAPGFTDQLIGAYSAEMDGMREGRSLSYEAMADLQARQAELGRYLYGRAIDFESTSRGQKSVADVQGTLTNMSQTAGMDPGQFQLLSDNWRKTVDALGGLDAGQREKLFEDGLAQLRMAAGMGLAQSDPMGVVAALKPGQIEGNVKIAADYFLSRGWTPVQVAGIIGNLQAESFSGLNPTARNPNGGAYGIAQWLGPRARQLNEFARAGGLDPTKLETQLAFVDWELRNSERAAGDALRAATTPEAAAAAIAGYERAEGWKPGDPTGMPDWHRRRSNTEALYSAMSGAAEPGKTGNPVLDAMPADERQRVQGAAESEAARIQASFSADFDTRLGDALAAFKSTGRYDAQPLTEQEFADRYGPQEGAARWTAFLTAKATGEQVARMQTMSMDEIDAMVRAAKPSSSGPGYALAEEAYQTLVDAAEDQRTARLGSMSNSDIQAMIVQTKPGAGATPEEQARWERISQLGNAEIARRQAATAETVEPRLRDALAALQEGVAYTGAPITRDELVAAYGPAEGQRQWDAYRELFDASETAAGLAQQNPADISAAVAAAQPTGGAGGEAEGQAAKIVADAASAVLEARARDPASYVAQAFPAVAAAWQAYDQAGDQAAKQAALTAAFAQMDAAYNQIGQPLNARPLLPASVVTAAIAGYKDETAGFEERVASLVGPVTASGTSAQQARIWDQMVKADRSLGKFHAAVDALLRGDQVAATAMFRAGTFDPTKLPGASALGSDLTTADINAYVQEHLMSPGQIGDIIYGLGSGIVGSEQAATNDAALLTDVIRYQLMRNGGDLETAAQLGRDYVFGGPFAIVADDATRIAIGSGYGVSTDPSSMDETTAMIQAGAEATRARFRPALEALVPQPPPDATPEQLRGYAIDQAYYRSEIERMLTKGILWSQGDRIVLVDPDTMQALADATGQAVGFPLSDLLALGRARRAVSGLDYRNLPWQAGP